MSQPFILVVKPKSSWVTYLNMKKTLKQPLLKIVFVFVTALLLSKTSFAYLSLNETAELIKEGHYRIGVVPQLLLSNGGGTNVGAFLDLPVQNDVNARFMLGSGNTDFWASASAKWVPYPDYKKQPAMGVRGSFIYARESTLNFYNLQITPLISKIVDSRWGKLNPYLGLPITFVFNNNENTTAMQLAVGTEWIDRPDFQIGAEFDMNLSNTNSALTLHINFPFDGDIGFRK